MNGKEGRKRADERNMGVPFELCLAIFIHGFILLSKLFWLAM